MSAKSIPMPLKESRPSALDVGVVRAALAASDDRELAGGSRPAIGTVVEEAGPDRKSLAKIELREGGRRPGPPPPQPASSRRRRGITLEDVWHLFGSCTRRVDCRCARRSSGRARDSIGATVERPGHRTAACWSTVRRARDIEDARAVLEVVAHHQVEVAVPVQVREVVAALVNQRSSAGAIAVEANADADVALAVWAHRRQLVRSQERRRAVRPQ